MFLFLQDGRLLAGLRRDARPTASCSSASRNAAEAYGTVAVFEDLYGNLWDLVQPKKGVDR